MAAAPTLVLVLSIVVALFGGVARGEAGYQIESADYPTTLASGHESSERDVFKLAFQRAHVKDGVCNNYASFFILFPNSILFPH